MAHRHTVQTKARGGGVNKADVAYGNKDVIEEARSTANKKRGGRAKKKDGGAVAGFKSGGRLDKRARGGRTGADKSPFSSAKTGKSVSG